MWWWGGATASLSGGPPLQSTTSRTNQGLVDATRDVFPFQRHGSACMTGAAAAGESQASLCDAVAAASGT